MISILIVDIAGNQSTIKYFNQRQETVWSSPQVNRTGTAVILFLMRGDIEDNVPSIGYQLQLLREVYGYMALGAEQPAVVTLLKQLDNRVNREGAL